MLASRKWMGAYWLYSSTINPFDMNQLASIELNGRGNLGGSPMAVEKNQFIEVIDHEHELVKETVSNLFGDDLQTQSVGEIIHTIHNHLQTFDYIAEHTNEWQDLTTIFSRNGGDCEDLAHLEVSLITNALIGAGHNHEAQQFSVVAGHVGAIDNRIGHTVIQFNDNGKGYVLDATLNDGLILKDAYASVYGWVDQVEYSKTSSIETIKKAQAVNTATEYDDEDRRNAANSIIGFGLDNTIENGDGSTRNIASDLYHYYHAVTDESYSGSDTLEAASIPLDTESLTFERNKWAQTYEAPSDDLDSDYYADLGLDYEDSSAPEGIDFNAAVYVAESKKFYEVETGINSGEVIQTKNFKSGISYKYEHLDNALKLKEELTNLTDTAMNKYVGQSFSGYYIYDYGRITRLYSAYECHSGGDY